MEFDNSAFDDRELVTKTTEFEKSLTVTVNKKLDKFKVRAENLRVRKRKDSSHASRVPNLILEIDLIVDTNLCLFAFSLSLRFQ